MRRSFAPSQFRDVVKKPRFFPPESRLEKENDKFSGTNSTLSETLKIIRKSNATTDNCEPNTEEANEKFTPLLSTSTKKLESQSDINASTHVRGESNDATRLKNVVKQVVSVVTSKIPHKSKFPTTFISPVMKSKDASNSVSDSGDVSANTDDDITSHYYSVVW